MRFVTAQSEADHEFPSRPFPADRFQTSAAGLARRRSARPRVVRLPLGRHRGDDLQLGPRVLDWIPTACSSAPDCVSVDSSSAMIPHHRLRASGSCEPECSTSAVAEACVLDARVPKHQHALRGDALGARGSSLGAGKLRPAGRRRAEGRQFTRGVDRKPGLGREAHRHSRTAAVIEAIGRKTEHRTVIARPARRSASPQAVDPASGAGRCRAQASVDFAGVDPGVLDGLGHHRRARAERETENQLHHPRGGRRCSRREPASRSIHAMIHVTRTGAVALGETGDGWGALLLLERLASGMKKNVADWAVEANMARRVPSPVDRASFRNY
jgi:hypothetical protein